jgi:hypothetical protein
MEFLTDDSRVEKLTLSGAVDAWISGTLRWRPIGEIVGFDVSKKIIDQALDRLAYARNLSIMPFELTDGECVELDDLSGQAVGNQRFVSSGLKFGGSMESAVEITPHNVRESLLKVPEGRDVEIALYRVAKASGDPIVRFLVMYQVLLSLFGDSQDRVDQFICGDDSKIPRTEKPKRPKRENNFKISWESKFTRLRNEMAHKRENVDLAVTRREIEAAVDQLSTIVKSAIQKVGGSP